MEWGGMEWGGMMWGKSGVQGRVVAGYRVGLSK